MDTQCSIMCFRRFCTGISSTPWLPLLRSTLFRAESRFSRDIIRSINIGYASFREQRFFLCQLCSTILKSHMEFTTSSFKHAFYGYLCSSQVTECQVVVLSQLFSPSHSSRVRIVLWLLLTSDCSAIHH